MSGSARARRGRRGLSLIHQITAMGVGAGLLGFAVPLTLFGQRVADRALRQARVNAAARELGARFQQDVREAVHGEGSGAGIRLTLSGGEVVTYARRGERLVREVRRAGGPAAAWEFPAPVAFAHFTPRGREWRLEVAWTDLPAGVPGRRRFSWTEMPRVTP